MNTTSSRELITKTINENMQGLPIPEQVQKQQADDALWKDLDEAFGSLQGVADLENIENVVPIPEQVQKQQADDALWKDLDEAFGSLEGVADLENIENVLGETSTFPLGMRDVGQAPFEGTQLPQLTAQGIPADNESWMRSTGEGLEGGENVRTPGDQDEGDDRMDIDQDPSHNTPGDDGTDAVWGGWKSSPVRDGWYEMSRSSILNDARAAVARQSDTNESSSNWPHMGEMRRKAELENDLLNTIRWSFLQRMVADYESRLHADTARLLTTELQFLVDLYRVSSLSE
ncbi:hypothetical protein R1sor_025484 [Riccia sorocarpa]|uniref:Uncharacterized protein n=1 Tax=Riccia sorocarpa TaxID=122646 RepID=A0ABD3GCE7_9MARC